MAQDVCHKTETFDYGGKGYLYLLARVVPRMHSRGFDQVSIGRILVDNPGNTLAFRDPGTSG